MVPQLHDFSRARTAVSHFAGITRWPWPTIVAPMTRALIRADASIGNDQLFYPGLHQAESQRGRPEAVRMTSGINNRWWLDLITKGELPCRRARQPGRGRR